MFSPGYAQVGRLLDGDTVALKCGVNVGDCIVAVNGQGFRRFAPDYEEKELENRKCCKLIVFSSYKPIFLV